MDKEQRLELVEQIDALDALARLFKSRWFAKVKDEVDDPKIAAYLTVFEDGFPDFNHVIRFARGCLVAMDHNGDMANRVRREAAVLLEEVLGQEDAAAGDFSESEIEALDTVESEDLDDLFKKEDPTSTPTNPVGERAVEAGDIDALFNAPVPDSNAIPEDLDALLAEDENELDIDTAEPSLQEEIEVHFGKEEVLGGDDLETLLDESEDETEIAGDELQALIDDDEDEDEEEIEAEGDDLKALLDDEEDDEEDDEDDLSALLEDSDEDETDEAEDDDDLTALMGEDDDEVEDDDDLSALLADVDDDEEEEGFEALLPEEDEEVSVGGEDTLFDEEEKEEGAMAGISADEMAALLDDEPKKAPAKKAPEKKAAAPTKKAPAKKAAAPKEPAKKTNDDEALSEDEIDALFG